MFNGRNDSFFVVFVFVFGLPSSVVFFRHHFTERKRMKKNLNAIRAMEIEALALWALLRSPKILFFFLEIVFLFNKFNVYVYHIRIAVHDADIWITACLHLILLLLLLLF